MIVIEHKKIMVVVVVVLTLLALCCSIIETLQEQQPGPSRSRQTIMLSATLSAGVEKLAGKQ